MTTERLQVLVWFLMPIFALVLMVALMGARGGIWIIFPIILLFLGGGALYLLILLSRNRTRGH